MNKYKRVTRRSVMTMHHIQYLLDHEMGLKVVPVS